LPDRPRRRLSRFFELIIWSVAGVTEPYGFHFRADSTVAAGRHADHAGPAGIESVVVGQPGRCFTETGGVDRAASRATRLARSLVALAKQAIAITTRTVFFGRPFALSCLPDHDGGASTGLACPSLAHWPRSRRFAEQLRSMPANGGYLARPRQDIAAYRGDTRLELPTDLDYVAGRQPEATEIRQSWSTHRPATPRQAVPDLRPSPPGRFWSPC